MKTNLTKSIALGAALVALSGGAALAAQATASVNVRTGPGTQYRVIDTLYPGERVTVTGRAGGWCHLVKAGPDGWASCAYITGSGMRYMPRQPSITLQFGFGYPHYPRYPHYPHFPNGGGNWPGNGGGDWPGDDDYHHHDGPNDN